MIHELQRQIEQMKPSIAQLKTSAEAMNQQIARLKASSETKNQQISQLKAKNEARERELDEQLRYEVAKRFCRGNRFAFLSGQPADWMLGLADMLCNKVDKLPDLLSDLASELHNPGLRYGTQIPAKVSRGFNADKTYAQLPTPSYCSPTTTIITTTRYQISSMNFRNASTK